MGPTNRPCARWRVSSSTIHPSINSSIHGTTSSIRLNSSRPNPRILYPPRHINNITQKSKSLSLSLTKVFSSIETPKSSIHSFNPNSSKTKATHLIPLRGHGQNPTTLTLSLSVSLLSYLFLYLPFLIPPKLLTKTNYKVKQTHSHDDDERRRRRKRRVILYKEERWLILQLFQLNYWWVCPRKTFPFPSFQFGEDY